MTRMKPPRITGMYFVDVFSNILDTLKVHQEEKSWYILWYIFKYLDFFHFELRLCSVSARALFCLTWFVLCASCALCANVMQDRPISESIESESRQVFPDSSQDRFGLRSSFRTKLELSMIMEVKFAGARQFLIWRLDVLLLAAMSVSGEEWRRKCTTRKCRTP